MKKICICGKEFESKTGKARYCSQKCRFKEYYQKHKELWHFYNNKNRITKKEQKKIEAEQKRIEAENKAKREKRRNDINRLMTETGLKNKYGLVASFYDTNNLEGLYKYADYLKSIGEIKEDINEPKIVKSHGGKITGGFDYFMISTN